MLEAFLVKINTFLLHARSGSGIVSMWICQKRFWNKKIKELKYAD